MFSALKKLTSSSPSPTAPAPPANGHHQHASGPANGSAVAMSDSLQRKFARGVQYNMKIIIKGDRNVGKTCLLHRLQGQQFVEAYRPSDEIQVASIQWSFKPSEADVVKVEVWDVVDRGKARSAVAPAGLKLATMAPFAHAPQPALDAEFLDVYKGTHGVVLMMDITKAWTFEYVVRELPRIPQDIPVLILGNHCDMAHHRVISTGQLIGLIEEHADRPAEIHYGDSSMRNGFGLRLLHRFLGLPFLRLQKETLLSQLQRNQRETLRCSDDLCAFLQSDEADYAKFIDQLSTRRRQIADGNPKAVASSVLAHSASNSSVSSAASAAAAQPNDTGAARPAAFGKSIIVGGGQPIVVPGQLNATNAVRQSDNVRPPVRSTAGFVSNLLVAGPAPVLNVDEFCPDGGNGLDRSFLDDDAPTPAAIVLPPVASDDSDDDDIVISSRLGANPLVARFHDEPTPDESPAHRDLRKPAAAAARINPLAKNGHTKQAAAAAASDAFAGDVDAELDASLVALRIRAPVPASAADDDQRRRSPEGLEDPMAAAMLSSTMRCTTDDVVDAPPDDEPKAAAAAAAAKSARKPKKERNETKAERHARRAEKKNRRRSKEASGGGGGAEDDVASGGEAGSIDADAYEAL